jgi:nucleotide-binding universal stress UspA family protein
MTAYRTMIGAVHDTERGFRAVDRAIEMAACSGSTLRLVAAHDHGVGPVESEAFDGTRTPDGDEVALSPPPSDAGLQRAAVRARERGVPHVEYTARRGRPVDVLIHDASASRAGVVVVGSHGLTSTSGRVFGSVARTTARRSPCDVLIVHTTDERWHLRAARRRRLESTSVPYTRIVAGVHNSRRDPASTAQVIERAAAISVDCHAELTLVSAYTPVPAYAVREAERDLDSHLFAELDYALHGSGPVEAELRTAADAAVAAGADPPRTRARQGRAGKVLVDTAGELGADLVVVGSHGLDSVGSRLLGAVASAVLSRTPADVLIVNTSHPRPPSV